MSTIYNIRKIDKNDFEFVYHSLCELENEILEASGFKEIFNDNIENKNYLYLIAENKNEKIGFITFHTQNLLHHCGLVGEIQEFYIIPNYRKKGVGRQLFNKITDFSAKQNLKSIEVTTNKKRIENIAIYENLGFNLTHNKFTICT
ncbi:MAG: GNAT family N-acetyltransferase [Saprospiraceae bacterium]|nr:GNAT family N-acetyltransferase [Saprospiraceae bacterium]MBK8370063.1 GNAT family N-acetyltransferase [Saprospiraceae bacterium]